MKACFGLEAVSARRVRNARFAGCVVTGSFFVCALVMLICMMSQPFNQQPAGPVMQPPPANAAKAQDGSGLWGMLGAALLGCASAPIFMIAANYAVGGVYDCVDEDEVARENTGDILRSGRWFRCLSDVSEQCRHKFPIASSNTVRYKHMSVQYSYVAHPDSNNFAHWMASNSCNIWQFLDERISGMLEGLCGFSEPTLIGAQLEAEFASLAGQIAESGIDVKLEKFYFTQLLVGEEGQRSETAM